MLQGAESGSILRAAVEKGLLAVMSYMSRGKWRATKVLVLDLYAERLSVEVLPGKRPHPMNISVGQTVGISLKYGYGKFLFETKILDLQPSPNSRTRGIIVLALPEKIELVQKRNYFRVQVPRELSVKVKFWHRKGEETTGYNGCFYAADDKGRDNFFEGQLVDLSAGGAQVAVDITKKADFKNGQFIGLQFSPIPYEEPLSFNAQIKNIFPTADGSSLCYGLQAVGLDASPQGRSVLQRLCDVVERYYQMNQSGVKHQDMQ